MATKATQAAKAMAGKAVTDSAGSQGGTGS